MRICQVNLAPAMRFKHPSEACSGPDTTSTVFAGSIPDWGNASMPGMQAVQSISLQGCNLSGQIPALFSRQAAPI